MRPHGAATRAHLSVATTTTMCLCIHAAVTAESLPDLKLEDQHFVDEQGDIVTLRGCNLGNWFLIEPWMLGLRDDRIRDQHDFITVLESRFGAEQAEQLMDIYRANWIGPREFEMVRSFGFNVVRLPFHYSLLGDDNQPFTLRDNAFEWLDRAIELAEQAGVYVILDMHGAPGGQSTDMPSGRVGENRLWDEPEFQQRTAWLWARIAERYRDRTTVIAYDLINEPWGDFQTDVRPKLLEIMDQIYQAIREQDPDTLIFMAGTLQGMDFYGDPEDHGWTNVGYTEHAYPGLFGTGSPSLETHARFMAVDLTEKQRFIESVNVPFLLGEFNVVYESAGGAAMMRRYYDVYADNGWLSTMWSLRVLTAGGGVGPDNWYLTTNAEPFQLPDLHSASYDEVRAAFEQLGSMDVVVDEALRDALTASSPTDLPLPTPKVITQAPADETLDGWTCTDIADAASGGAVVHADGSVTIYGAGHDIWGASDSFRYVHRAADNDFDLSARLLSFDAPHHFAKAGWMLRSSLEPDAAHLFLHAFPDGRIIFAERETDGGMMSERTLALSRFPMGLAMSRRGSDVTLRYTDADGVWREQTVSVDNRFSRESHIGLAVLGHSGNALAAATFDGVGSSTSDEDVPNISDRGQAENLLRNASFEQSAGDDKLDRALGWDRWGHWFNRETNSQPTRDGEGVLVYHHDRIEAPDNSGVYQDIEGLRPGQRYVFEVYAQRDQPEAGGSLPASVEVRLEVPNGQRMLNVSSRTYPAEDITVDGGWSLLRVTGTMPVSDGRALIIVNPGSADQKRDARIRFDSASLFISEAQY